MTTARVLAVLVAGVATTAGPATAQYRPPGFTPGFGSPLDAVVPSVAPADPDPEPPPLPGRAMPAGGVMPPYLAPGLESLTKPGAVPPPPADAYGSLTGQTVGGVPVPKGGYASPWFADGPGCCGPMGRDGRVGYDIYSRTGVNLAVSSGAFNERVRFGWQTALGGRTLFFNRSHDAAWAFDLGFAYTANTAAGDPLDLFVRIPPTQSGQGFRDQVETVRIVRLHRTAFQYSLGRDWWLWGPGAVGTELGWNARCGLDLGGRYGTAHIDTVSVDNSNAYFRRQKIFHGINLGVHTDWEVPMGGWVAFGGLRAEAGYDWLNIAPPIKADLLNVNLLLSFGIRY